MYDKPLLPHMEPENAAQILSQLPSSTPINQPHLVTNIPMSSGLGRKSLRRKVPNTNLLLKPKVFSQSAQIEGLTVPSQKPQIPTSQRIIHPTFVERKQII